MLLLMVLADFVRVAPLVGRHARVEFRGVLSPRDRASRLRELSTGTGLSFNTPTTTYIV